MTRAVPVGLDEPPAKLLSTKPHIYRGARELRKNDSNRGKEVSRVKESPARHRGPEIAGHDWAVNGERSSRLSRGHPRVQILRSARRRTSARGRRNPVINEAGAITIWRTSRRERKLRRRRRRRCHGKYGVSEREGEEKREEEEGAENINAAFLIVSQDPCVSRRRRPTLPSILLRNVPASRYAIVCLLPSFSRQFWNGWLRECADLTRAHTIFVRNYMTITVY